LAVYEGSALWKGVTISFMASSSFSYWSRGISRHSLSPLSQVSLKRMESRANSSLVVKPICLFFFDEILSLNQQFRQKRYWLVQERVYGVLVSLHFRKKGGVADNIFSWGRGSNPPSPLQHRKMDALLKRLSLD